MTYFSDAFQRQLEGLFHRTADADLFNTHLARLLSPSDERGPFSQQLHIWLSLPCCPSLLTSNPSTPFNSVLQSCTDKHLTHLTPTKHLDVYHAEFKHQQPGFGQQRRRPVARQGSKFESTTEIESCSCER